MLINIRGSSSDSKIERSMLDEEYKRAGKQVRLRITMVGRMTELMTDGVGNYCTIKTHSMFFIWSSGSVGRLSLER
jgi:hypothetical protein